MNRCWLTISPALFDSHSFLYTLRAGSTTYASCINHPAMGKRTHDGGPRQHFDGPARKRICHPPEPSSQKRSTEGKISHSSVPKTKPPTPIPFPTIADLLPFRSPASDRILLVGEGDFSYARALVTQYRCRNVTATCFDSETQLKDKYAAAAEHVGLLKGSGALVLFGVDATRLNGCKGVRTASRREATRSTKKGAGSEEVLAWLGLRGAADGREEDKNSSGQQNHEDEWDEDEWDDDEWDDEDEGYQPADAHKLPGFDCIIFNFPHTGGLTTDVNRQVRANQQLLTSFFQSAIPLLAAEISSRLVVTLFEGEPYTLWSIRDLARHSGLAVFRSFAFDARLYKGYAHSRTVGDIRKKRETGGKAQAEAGEDGPRKEGWKGEDRRARTYVLGRREDVKFAPGQSGSKKRKPRDRNGGAEDDSSED